jgi:hypothetical protein
VGGISVTLSSLVVALGIVSIVGAAPAVAVGGALATLGIYSHHKGAAKSVASPMLELAKYKEYDNRLIKEEEANSSNLPEESDSIEENYSINNNSSKS